MLTLLEFRVLGVEPTCFDRMPSDDGISQRMGPRAARPPTAPQRGPRRGRRGQGTGPARLVIGPLERKLLYLRGKGTGAPGRAGRRGPGRRRPPLDPRAPPPLTSKGVAGRERCTAQYGSRQNREWGTVTAPIPPRRGGPQWPRSRVTWDCSTPIACAESHADTYLNAWAEVTPDHEVRALLRTIAAREGEHGMAFAKRINELGYELRPREDPGFDEQMEIASSRDRSDLDKLEALGLLKIQDRRRARHLRQLLPRPLDRHPDRRVARPVHRRGARHVRLLQGCCADAHRARHGPRARAAPRTTIGSFRSRTSSTRCVAAVEELRQIVCAQTMPAASA